MSRYGDIHPATIAWADKERERMWAAGVELIRKWNTLDGSTDEGTKTAKIIQVLPRWKVDIRCECCGRPY